jgi:hypothetical protein
MDQTCPVFHKSRRPQARLDSHTVLHLFCFVFTRSGWPAIASVPDLQDPPLIFRSMSTCNVSRRGRRGCNACVVHCIGSIPHDVIQHQGPTAAISIFPWRGISLKYWLPMLLHFCTRNRGNRCFNIVRPLALEFGLLRMVRQPSADTHVIWVARHKVTRPQTILKFRPPSSLDYRTRHGSQSTVLHTLWCDRICMQIVFVRAYCVYYSGWHGEVHRTICHNLKRAF